MSAMSYISIIERYHEYQAALQELLASIITGIAEERLLTNAEARSKSMHDLAEHYPFVNLLYTLDLDGIQTSANITSSGKPFAGDQGMGKDRSQRPYYRLAQAGGAVVVTEPYLSSASRRLCVSTVIKLSDTQQRVKGYVVLDIDLGEAIEFLMGDTGRRRFVPFFKMVYVFIVAGLFTVVVALLHSAFTEVVALIDAERQSRDLQLKPFGVIIFITLALAVFDLGKTTLEEEVLMHKDIFRHSSTRRTITRFIAAILIAVSIEALLLMFKSALGDGHELVPAVWMMLGAVGLLTGLGIYVFLGAKAEAILLSARK
ncbi:MAG: PDC sensor domain-containing protein [Pseudomonadota bacterium]